MVHVIVYNMYKYTYWKSAVLFFFFMSKINSSRSLDLHFAIGKKGCGSCGYWRLKGVTHLCWHCSLFFLEEWTAGAAFWEMHGLVKCSMLRMSILYNGVPFYHPIKLLMPLRYVFYRGYLDLFHSHRHSELDFLAYSMRGKHGFVSATLLGASLQHVLFSTLLPGLGTSRLSWVSGLLHGLMN